MSAPYDANGTKWRQTNNGEVHEYVAGIEYVDQKLLHIMHSEGRMIPTTTDDATGATSEGRVEYFIKDHLGNTRVTISDLDKSGTIALEDDESTAINESELLQENHYYPFGMDQKGNWSAVVGTENPYKYNGKEKLEGVGLYDYGARYYDPAIARWTGVDVLADHPSQIDKSVYAYAWDNPVSFTDPDGNCPLCALVAAGFEYGSQVYGNIKNGDSGWDAWARNVDVGDVGIEFLSNLIPGGKLVKGLAMAVGEVAKVGTDLKGDGSGAYLGDGSGEKQLGDVIEQSGKNIAINLIGKGVSDKMGTTLSDKALKKTKSNVVAAKKNLTKAKNKAGTGYSSSPEVYARSQQLAGAQDSRNFVEIGNGLGLGIKNEAARQVIEETTKIGTAKVSTGVKNVLKLFNGF